MKDDLNIQLAIKGIKGPYDCLILFGSYARGDFEEKSDIDILQVTSANGPHYISGKINFSPYSKSFLIQLAKESSLFVLHIISEGKVIAGDNNFIKDLKKNFIHVQNYNNYKNELINAGQLLCIDEVEYNATYKRYNLLACFLFRSFLYALAYEQNILTFSIHQMSINFKDPEIENILALRKSSVENYPLFNKLVKKMAFYSNNNLCNPNIKQEEFYNAHIHTDTFPGRMISKYLRTDDEIY